MTILELISALKWIESLNLRNPVVFINANNNLAVRYENGVESYGVWIIDLQDGAKLAKID